MPPVPSACPGKSQTTPNPDGVKGMWGPSAGLSVSRSCVFICVACVSAAGPGAVGRYHVKKLKKTVDFFFFYMPFLCLCDPIVMMSTVPTNSCTIMPDYYREHIHTTQLKL